MFPVLSHNDLVVTREKKISAGDIVVLNIPRFGRVVKRVKILGKSSCLLTGDNSSEQSSCCSTAHSTEYIIGSLFFTIRMSVLMIHKDRWIRKLKQLERLFRINVKLLNSGGKS